jgi:hypothetical protein
MVLEIVLPLCASFLCVIASLYVFVLLLNEIDSSGEYDDYAEVPR